MAFGGWQWLGWGEEEEDGRRSKRERNVEVWRLCGEVLEGQVGLLADGAGSSRLGLAVHSLLLGWPHATSVCPRAEGPSEGAGTLLCLLLSQLLNCTECRFKLIIDILGNIRCEGFRDQNISKYVRIHLSHEHDALPALYSAGN